MSTIAVNAITDVNAGNTTTINGVTPNSANVVGKNLVINGAMQIAQRGTSVTGITSGSNYTCDRWRFQMSTAGTWTLTQDTDAPDGFGNSMKLACTTANASPSATTYILIQHRIEGQFLQQLAKGTSSAKKVTVSFWIKCSKTGNIQVNLRDKNNLRLIGQIATINVANTWEKKTLTFDGDTTGTLNNDNTEGMALQFYLEAGSNFTGGAVPTSWEAEAATDRAAGVTLALADSTSNTLNITGVQLEVGESATEFEHRPYGMELQLCQRYYEVTSAYFLASEWYASGGSQAQHVNVGYAVAKRTTPTVVLPSTTASVNLSAQPVARTQSTDSFGLWAASAAAGFTYWLYDASKFVTSSAEL